jgi:hypothetical protein
MIRRFVEMARKKFNGAAGTVESGRVLAHGDEGVTLSTGYVGSRGKGWKRSPQVYTPCYKSHPALELVDGLEIFGGSCLSPVMDADIFIGFDSGMRHTLYGMPWSDGHEVEFYVADHSVPRKDEIREYKKLVAWTIDELRAGKLIHAGCIGGHGRTGMFFAAIVKEMGISNDAITYVRKHYCGNSVESREQVDFLAKHFGVSRIEMGNVGAAKLEKSWGVWDSDESIGWRGVPQKSATFVSERRGRPLTPYSTGRTVARVVPDAAASNRLGRKKGR